MPASERSISKTWILSLPIDQFELSISSSNNQEGRHFESLNGVKLFRGFKANLTNNKVAAMKVEDPESLILSMTQIIE